jgi:peptidoglycan/LPS O-acetylase OafA/YrhL
MSRYAFLDGLRGWGALFVLLFHVVAWDISFVDAAYRPWVGRLLPFNGPFAVAVFFVVSGFSLSIRHVETRDRTSLARLALGRYVRLTIPIFAACVATHLAIASGLMNIGPDRHLFFVKMFPFEPTWSHLLQFSLFDVYFDYSLSKSYLGVLWTMPLELFGSFILLALLAVSPRRPKAFVLFFVGASALALVFRFDKFAAYVALFCIGAALAQAFHTGWLDRIPRWLLVAALLASVIAPLVYTRRNWEPYTIVCVATGIFVAACIGIEQIRTFLSGPLSSRLGVISFPLYLMHGAVIHIVGEPIMRFYGYTTATAIVADVCVIVLSIATACLFAPVDRFAQHCSRRFSSSVMDAFRSRTAAAEAG